MGANPVPLAFGNYYHVFNRGNNREDLFIEERNYAYFMELWWKYTYPIAETYAYCLLKNHFHAVVYIKEKEELTDCSGHASRPEQNPSSLKQPSQYFSNLFNAYTRAVNSATQRTGALFERPFERIPVADESYLMRLIVYIHRNPQKHRFVEDFRDWRHSSYQELISTGPTRLQRQRVMGLFEGKETFVRIHGEMESEPGAYEET